MQNFENSEITVEPPTTDPPSPHPINTTPNIFSNPSNDNEEIRKQFERGSKFVGVPDPKKVNEMFEIIGQHEESVMDEAYQAREAEGVIEERLWEARCEYFELRDEIEAVRRRGEGRG